MAANLCGLVIHVIMNILEQKTADNVKQNIEKNNNFFVGVFNWHKSVRCTLPVISLTIFTNGNIFHLFKIAKDYIAEENRCT
jgi:hypothetical protein